MRIAANARAVAADAAIVISSITEDHGVRQIFENSPAGFLEGDVNGKLFIEMSTLQPMTGRELAPLVEAQGGQFLEAPVLGEIPRRGRADFRRWSADGLRISNAHALCSKS